MFKIAALQMTSCGAIGPNLMTAKLLLERAAEAGADCAVLPEHFAFLPPEASQFGCVQEFSGEGRVQNYIAEQAQALGLWIVAGTHPIASTSGGKARAASIVWNDMGEQVSRYDKIHLFDIKSPFAHVDYQESSGCEPGDAIRVVPTPFGQLGIAVGYDIRFPELFRAMRERGAEIIVVPGSFQVPTGPMHLRSLLRARAIENQVYIVMANQSGLHDNGWETYGNSMIINPWGEVLDCREIGVGQAMSEINLELLHRLWDEFPVWAHRRIDAKGDLL